MKVCFNKVLRPQYTDDASFMEQLFCVIFFQCGERCMMLEGIQDLLMVCKDEQTIREKKHQLLHWVTEDPSSILQKAHQENTALPLSEYLEDMHNCISSTFKRSITKHGNMCIFRERIILRYVVYMQLQLMDRHKVTPQKSLIGYRNPDTPVEQSIVQRQKKEKPQPSASVVEKLDTATPFFTRVDLARIRATELCISPEPTTTGGLSSVCQIWCST